MVFENLIALIIAIEKETSQEKAFAMLDKALRGEDPSYAFVRYTEEDYQDMEKLLAEGVTQTEVASYYGLKKSNFCVFLSSKRRKNKQL